MIGIILAGGQGMRLRPLTDSRPKTLIPINGKPLVEYQLNLIKPHVTKAVFACGYLWGKIKETYGDNFGGLPLEYSVETEKLGTGGAVKKAMVGSDAQDVLITNGDVVTDFDLKSMIDWHNQTGSTVTMLAIPYRSPYGVIEIDKLRTVRRFDEKPEFKDVWVNGGFYLAKTKRIYSKLPDVGDIEKETFPKLTRYGEIQAYINYGLWHSIDSLKDLQEAEGELKRLGNGSTTT